VVKAVTDKLIKAERKDTLIATGVSNEAALDFLDDLVVTATTRRGAPPVPKGEGEVESLESLRDELQEAIKAGDGVRCSTIALKLRDLRGHKNLFAVETK
jgi:uncharacterized NAD(P)/FAD-binding protein YdhS